ncbi:MAG: MinD/ParA family ATP-binding protein, partial [Candidatus Kryptoniota bacterium]
AMTKLSENLYLIAGSSDGTYRKLGSGEIASLFNEISNLEPRFDYVVVDTAAGIVQESISFGILCDDIYIVSTPEPTAVMDAYVLVKALKRINSGSNLKLLINNVVDAQTAEEVKEKFDIVTMHFLNTRIDYAGFVPTDEAVVRSVNVQTPLMIEFPDSKAAKAIEEITSRILERVR